MIFRRLRHWFFRFIRLALLCAVLLIIPSSTLLLSDPWRVVGVIVGARHFDYVGWEIRALAAKVEAALFGAHPFMSEADRAAFVRAYMDDLAQAGRLEREIAAIYTDPAVDDPVSASAALTAERDALRADLASRQTLAESILEGQVAAVLVEQGFGVGGQLIPPIAMRFTETPQLLVVSPRNEIKFDIGFNLNPLPVDAAAALETQIDAALDASSLIVPIGGLALYPAMILERSSVASALDTFAHEWLHHYLFMYPLGLSYDFSGEARIINETTANLFGQEIGRMVAERYYPELIARTSPLNLLSTWRGDLSATNFAYWKQDAIGLRLPLSTWSGGRGVRFVQPFDFGAELDETRRTVDELLAAGRIEEAETYMEARRQLFVANGYGIRKLNQAFFAFYGGYQSGEPGAGGDDPIGAAVAAIHAASPSLYDWIVTMRTITTRDELLQAAASV